VQIKVILKTCILRAGIITNVQISNIILGFSSYVVAKSDLFIDCHALRERLTRTELLGFTFMFSGLVEAPRPDYSTYTQRKSDFHDMSPLIYNYLREFEKT